MPDQPNPPTPSGPRILALVRDLMFSGRIAAEARAASVAFKIVRDPAQLPSAGDGVLLLVDLNLPGATDAAAAWRAAHSLPVVGFVSHVDAAAIAHAREVGLDKVMARSQFVSVLPEMLASLAAAPG